ncbi:unnamed protein product [Adineta ricciae]|uniref:Uncharacterized protein n=1 Tax=Adineta ricciae TaxID=249248 RepID=A0A814MZT2_ADIRI|nr:unnamed protein product [Adineta ricciae]CAF1085475.1 unnamed protein product [Adineta ricciae]
MTKGGSGKSKTLGRLIFGEKRKQHVSPARHRSSTRHASSTADIPSSNVTTTNKNSIDLHDWAMWRMQLNEQMGSSMNERRSDLKQMRQFLQSNPFYQQHSRDLSNGRYNGVRLLFSIPHTKLKPEFLNEIQETAPRTNEIGDAVVYEQKKIRSNSDDRTTTSVNSLSAIQPMIVDKAVNQLLPKACVGNTGGFLQTNEQMIAMEGIRTRRTTRSSFTASDRIHATLQKAVKDGNVLEKIKAFEMQAAAAAQAESIPRLNGINYRMQTLQAVAQRTLSPATIHPIQQVVSPIQIQEQSLYPNQQYRDDLHGLMPGHKSRKGAHVLEPAHGDIILKRRPPSQKAGNEDEYSGIAISSMALTASQGQHRNHHHHRRSSVSRSRHRQEIAYDKRTSSRHESHSRRHSSKQKGTSTPSAKLSTRHRWLKGRKETPVETPSRQGTNPDIANNRSNKTKKKTVEHEKVYVKKATKTVEKEKSPSDNNRVYGVPNASVIEHAKIEEQLVREHVDRTSTLIAIKDDDTSQNRACDIVIQQRHTKNHQQQKLSSTDGDILNKVDENPRSTRSSGYRHHHSEHDGDGKDGHSTDDDVFIEDKVVKPRPNLTRHQSTINTSKADSRRLQQQSSSGFRRHASQCSADDAPLLNSMELKKQKSPLTLITRTNPTNCDEAMTYETPQSEQIQPPVCNTHTMKKKRPFHTINTAGCSIANNQQMSKQILHAIMNSMNHNQEPLSNTPPPIPASPTSVNDDFFENGPLTNPEETIANMTPSS